MKNDIMQEWYNDKLQTSVSEITSSQNDTTGFCYNLSAYILASLV